jgi:multicomponent Na+:H+ antiporter subunit D
MAMMTQLPAILVAGPFLAAFAVSIFSWLDSRYCYPITLLGLLTSLGASLGLLFQVTHTGPVHYTFAGWEPPYGIELRIDLLNGLVLILVSAVAFLNLPASWSMIRRDMHEKRGTFLALYLLLVTGLLGVTATADLFNLYVLIEITSLASYALLAMGNSGRSPLASLNYVFLGVIGASFYLLGVGYLYILTGSLNMGDVATLLPSIASSQAVLVAFVFLMVGVLIKMAFFPLHLWLPNAYTFAPLAASRVIAPLMTKVMIYVMIRLIISVFGLEYVFETLDLSQAMVWLSSLAILAGAVMALAQNELKRMLSYIIVAEIGYMVGGFWLGNQAGMTGAILHLINDALMTFCLFLAAGNLAYKLKDLHFESLQGIFRTMPLTMSGFALAGVSIIGVPPTCGFFSKWYLLLASIEAGAYGFLVALIASSLISAVLFFRIFEIGYFEPLHHGHGHDHGHGAEDAVMAEAPPTMVIVLALVALGLIAVGLASGSIVNEWILPIVPRGLM